MYPLIFGAAELCDDDDPVAQPVRMTVTTARTDDQMIVFMVYAVQLLKKACRK